MDKVNSSFKVETNDAYFGPGGWVAAPPPGIRVRIRSSACDSSAAPNAASGATSGCKTELMAKPVVVVTGISGNLGSRLLPLLGSLFGDRGGRQSTPHRFRVAVREPGSGPGVLDPALYELLRDTHRLCRRSPGIRHRSRSHGRARCRAHVADQCGGNGARDGSRSPRPIAPRTTESSSLFFPAASRPTGQICRRQRRKNRRWPRTPFPTRSTKSSRTKWCSSGRTPCGDAASTFSVRTFLPARASRII